MLTKWSSQGVHIRDDFIFYDYHHIEPRAFLFGDFRCRTQSRAIVSASYYNLSYLLVAFGLGWAEPIVAILIIIGGIGGVATWIIGPTKGLLVAAQDGNAPAFLARTNSKGVPITIIMVQATIFTVLCSVFLMIPTVSSSYFGAHRHDSSIGHVCLYSPVCRSAVVTL